MSPTILHESGFRFFTSSAVEVTHISKHGFWLLVDEKELFLPFVEFPWFKHAPLAAVFNIERLQSYHLYWPDLDIDLTVESIEHPEKFPLIAVDRDEQPVA